MSPRMRFCLDRGIDDGYNVGKGELVDFDSSVRPFMVVGDEELWLIGTTRVYILYTEKSRSQSTAGTLVIIDAPR